MPTGKFDAPTPAFEEGQWVFVSSVVPPEPPTLEGKVGEITKMMDSGYVQAKFYNYEGVLGAFKTRTLLKSTLRLAPLTHSLRVTQ